MERICYVLQLRPERAVEYRQRHREVWPAQLEALQTAGWQNFSLFLRADGLLVAYCEPDDFAAALSGLAASEVNTRWQTEMSRFFQLPQGARPDTGFERLEEVFHLD